jgi:predicted metal-binding membrane protein
LTAVLSVAGVMDLRAMAAVTVAITLERVAPHGELFARGIGFVTIGAGLFMIARAASLA